MSIQHFEILRSTSHSNTLLEDADLQGWRKRGSALPAKGSSLGLAKNSPSKSSWAVLLGRHPLSTSLHSTAFIHPKKEWMQLQAMTYQFILKKTPPNR